MKKLIRKIINWAYGFNISIVMFEWHQAVINLHIMMRDLCISLQGEKKEIAPDDALRLHRIYKQLQWENPKITQEEFWEEVVRRFNEDEK